VQVLQICTQEQLQAPVTVTCAVIVAHEEVEDEGEECCLNDCPWDLRMEVYTGLVQTLDSVSDSMQVHCVLCQAMPGKQTAARPVSRT
jgi:hypothetical protein